MKSLEQDMSHVYEKIDFSRKNFTVENFDMTEEIFSKGVISIEKAGTELNYHVLKDGRVYKISFYLNFNMFLDKKRTLAFYREIEKLCFTKQNFPLRIFLFILLYILIK